MTINTTVTDIGNRGGSEIGKRRGVATDDEPEVAECLGVLDICVESLEIGGGASW